jgi:hypothetical protein
VQVEVAVQSSENPEGEGVAARRGAGERWPGEREPARSCPAGLLELGPRQRQDGLRIAACGSPFSLRFRASGKRACERSGTAALRVLPEAADAQRLFVQLEHPRRASP